MTFSCEKTGWLGYVGAGCGTTEKTLVFSFNRLLRRGGRRKRCDRVYAISWGRFFLFRPMMTWSCHGDAAGRPRACGAGRRGGARAPSPSPCNRGLSSRV